MIKKLPLLKSQNKLSPILTLQNSYTAMLLTDYQGNIQWANNASEQLFTTSAKRLRKQNVHHLLNSVHVSKNNQEATQQLTDTHNQADNKSKPTPSHKIHTKNAKKRLKPLISHDQWIVGTYKPLYVDYSISLIEGNEGITRAKPSSETEQYLVEIWSKDRHQRISQEHHQQNQHLIAKQMLRSVAHEVKNPLAGIRGAGQLLKKYIRALEITDHKINTYCDIIINETDRLNSLITQLLGSHQLPSWQELNIHQVLEHVLTLAHSQHPKLTIIRDYDLSMPEIKADKDQMIQVFLNLTNNAIQAMTSQDSVTVAKQQHQPSNQTHQNKQSEQSKDIDEHRLTIVTRVDFQYTIGAVKHKKIAKICIHDNGTGIDEKMIDKIFFPLVTGRAKGTGLGLSVVHDIIQQHQGHIDVTSRFGDTCFMVYLPFAE